jgi:autotransporter passenger strand-loop-strand repeat protein
LLGGAVVSGVTVNAGGVLGIGSGYTLSGYQVASGVTAEVASGGTASGVTVLSGGTLELLVGAVAQSFSVNPGGILEVASGYGLSGYEVSTGATLEVASGGTASASKIDSGGTAIVLSGGSIGGAAFIAGGTLLLRTNAVGGPVDFEGGGALKITGGSIPTGLIVSGWTPRAVLDLSAVAFSSSGTAQLGSGNVLQVAEGGSTYNVQLDPNASFAGEVFRLRSDGATGTDVTLGAVPTLGVSSDANATRGQTLTLSTLVTITDPSNVGYLQLELRDAIGTIAGGEFVVNGVAQSGGHEIDLAPASVGKTVFDVGTGGGTDTLWARLQRDDGSLTSWLQFTVTAPVARAPTLAVTSDNSASRGQTLALSSLVTITDPDGVRYQKLELWDSNGTAAGGQLVVNGKAQTGGHEIDVAPGDVANTVFDVGSLGGTDQLWSQLQLNNGQTTGWLQFSVTVPSPTLTVSNDPSAGRGQQIALSTLVAIADPGNVGYQKLELWDSNGTAAGGQFVVNSVPQTGGHEIDVAPANVANTVFDAGTAAGTDTLWAQLLQSNGQLTGWQPFSVTVPFPSLNVTSDPNAPRGQPVALSNLVTISDPAQVGFQKLELWDSSGTTAGGQFVIINSPQTGGHEIDVAPGDVAKTVFDVGTLGGTDMLWAQLLENNGQVTGWQPFTVTAPAAQLPTLTVNNFAGASAGQSIALTTLVTIADPDHVGYQKLELWDSNGTATTGQFVINGSPQGGGHEIDVNPGDVANSKFDVGSTGAPDTLWARLLEDNGTLTPWQQFTVKDPITIAADATVEISSAYAGAVSFAAGTGTLQLDNSASFSGTVAGMTGSDTIDFADIDPTKVQTPRYNGDGSGGTLSVSDGTHGANIALLGNYLASTFTAASDGHGGTAVTDPAVLGGVAPLVTPPHA